VKIVCGFYNRFPSFQDESIKTQAVASES